VDVGQTVAASMSAPTLFVIAADLTEMQVNANIDEADVGRIRPGQQVTFRVDAYPTDNFIGTVTQIRLQPVVVQNVTTYGTVITVPNRELKLKPGMTANVKIEIAKRTNALRIPNAALRFRPTAEVFAALNQEVPPEMTQAPGAGRGGRGGGGFGRGAGAGSPTAAAPAPQGNALPQSPRNTSAASPDDQGRGRRAGGAPPAEGGAPGAGRSGGGFGGRGGGGGPQSPEFQARMLERFKTMSPEEQQQFLARMKERGGDTSAFEAARPPAKKGAAKSATPQQASTIDALFAPLPVVESRGRAWLYIDNQLKPVTLRLGISDGTYTELISDELQETSEVVTGVTGLASTRGTPTQGGTGNPLMPGRGGPGGPGRGGRG
jgi:HlyD family secretion protein